MAVELHVVCAEPPSVTAAARFASVVLTSALSRPCDLAVADHTDAGDIVLADGFGNGVIYTPTRAFEHPDFFVALLSPEGRSEANYALMTLLAACVAVLFDGAIEDDYELLKTPDPRALVGCCLSSRALDLDGLWVAMRASVEHVRHDPLDGGQSGC